MGWGSVLLLPDASAMRPTSPDPPVAEHSRTNVPFKHPSSSLRLVLLQPRLSTADFFCVQAFLREEVANFRPTPVDIDFPACLLKQQESLKATSEPSVSPSGSDTPPPPRPPLAPPTPSAASGPSAPPQDPHSTWYPPLRQTLVCLAKLYRTVELPAFCGIGQDALCMCAAAIQSAAKLVTKQEGLLDGQLFAIRHLLLLREQISPFQAEFTATDRDLDFSHMVGQLQRVLKGQMPLFVFSRDNAVVQLVASGGIRVLENHVDSKQELEKALKTACEAFIMAVTKLTVEPMLSFLHKVTATKAAAKVGPLTQRPQEFVQGDHILIPCRCGCR
jgi:conserved oligomeric Golgi complex subunit 3